MLFAAGYCWENFLYRSHTNTVTATTTTLTLFSFLFGGYFAWLYHLAYGVLSFHIVRLCLSHAYNHPFAAVYTCVSVCVCVLQYIHHIIKEIPVADAATPFGY